eukprot:UN12986
MDDDMMGGSGGQQSETIHRLNGAMLASGQFKGNEVSIVGKYLGSNNKDNTKLPFEASDGQNFYVLIDISQPWTGYNSKYIEIRGVVQENGCILQQTYQEWGDDFAMSTWDKFVKLTHQFPQLF